MNACMYVYKVIVDSSYTFNDFVKMSANGRTPWHRHGEVIV